ncbi:hypothetical protein BY458DRAFT_467688 [Sporodiniella umbellata]|nr:hypothetical protein BY458DRAFT_467688 [Sporodiniella umbellata]
MKLKSITIYCVSGLFFFAILLQLNSYLAFVTLPKTQADDDVAIQEHYQREYKALILYIVMLTATLTVSLARSWLERIRYNKQKVLGISNSDYNKERWQWLDYEWKCLDVVLSPILVIELIALLAANFVLLLYTSNENSTSLTSRNLHLQGIANRAAQLSVVNIAIAVALSAKLSFIQRLFYSFESTISWHPWFSRVAFMEALYHGTYQLQYNYYRQEGNIFSTFTTNIRYVTGTFLLAALVSLVVGSHPLIRHISYQLFRLTHVCSFFALIIFGCLHHWAFYVFYASVLFFWILDQFDRSFKADLCTLEEMPGNIVKVQVTVPYTIPNFMPGEFVFLSFSSSMLNAWVRSHPFSICRVDYVDRDDGEEQGESNMSLLNNKSGRQMVTLYVKVIGKHTRRLQQKAIDQEKVKMRISRPLGRSNFGLSGPKYGDFETIVLIADGIGITPWISVLQYVHKKQHQIKTRYVHLIWSIHSIDTYYAFEKELVEFTNDLQDIKMNIHIFITGDVSDPEENWQQLMDFTPKYYRPNHQLLLNNIQKEDVIIGICTHTAASIQINNIALARFWAIHIERFQL